MSDLLPLVVAALNDKIAVDAQEEIKMLQKEVSRAVEILHRNEDEDDENVVVYASAQFQEGEYGGNTNLWQVNLKQKGTTMCRLADLRQCEICVGGGFPLESLNDQLSGRPDYEGFFDRDEWDSDTSKTVKFCFCPNTTWLTVVVHGWPRKEWERVITRQEGEEVSDPVDPGDMIEYLVDTVATEDPEATVEFKDVSFVAENIRGSLKRLLPPKRKAEVTAERDARDARDIEERQAVLFEFVANTMRDRGNDAFSVLFAQQVNDIMSLLNQTALQSLYGFEEEITNIIAAYENMSREQFLTVVERLNERDRDHEMEEA